MLTLRTRSFTQSVSVSAATTAMTLAILFPLKTMKSLQNGVATSFQVTLVFNKNRITSAELSQH